MTKGYEIDKNTIKKTYISACFIKVNEADDEANIKWRSLSLSLSLSL